MVNWTKFSNDETLFKVICIFISKDDEIVLGDAMLYLICFWIMELQLHTRLMVKGKSFKFTLQLYFHELLNYKK